MLVTLTLGAASAPTAKLHSRSQSALVTENRNSIGMAHLPNRYGQRNRRVALGLSSATRTIRSLPVRDYCSGVYGFQRRSKIAAAGRSKTA
jgi:hypothetical protein